MSSTISWPDEIDEIIGGDQAVALAHLTPARGIVLTPLTNFGIRNRELGTITPLNSSIGMWRKLARLRESPKVAVVYHTRKHGFSRRPEFVLVQGRASLSSLQDPHWLDRNRQSWERFAGPRKVSPLWERWLRVYHRRVGITITVERMLAWPDLACSGRLEVLGPAVPGLWPAPQEPPANGTGPRLDSARAARRVSARPHRLLGWAGGDGFPVVVPVDVVSGATPEGIALQEQTGLVPPGGRRAGLLGHSFARYTHGQHQRIHTGWLANEHGRLMYAPHTQRGYFLPASRTAYRIAVGFATRRGYRQARRAGFIAEP